MKVVVDFARLVEEMGARGWNWAQLRERSGVSHDPLARISRGEPVQIGTWVKLDRALQREPRISLVVPATPSLARRG